MDGPSLPRSIRWRLQLGLLALPNSEVDDDEEETTTLVTEHELYEYNASLLQDQRQRYQNLRDQYGEALEAFRNESNPTIQVDEEEASSNQTDTAVQDTSSDTITPLDPLTAMVREQEAQEKRRQELELKYRKERARRNRGISDEQGRNGESSNGGISVHESLQVIDKDLHRLQPDHVTYHHSRKRLFEPTAKDDFDASVRERTALLAEILHVHARQYPELGYRQGMHEIASYLLLVLEMDLYDVESALQEASAGLATTSTNTSSLLDASYLVHDAFIMLERVMTNLSPAYDVSQSPSAVSPMEQMGRSVVSLVKDVVCDQALYDVVQSMQCPPELYCTRWIRLAFSREVLGWRNVLLLWDVFMDCMTCHESILSMNANKYTKPGISPPLQLGRFTFMQVLESTAVSMILLQRQALMDSDGTEAIQILMNVPPLKNVVPLTATLLSVLRRRQVGSSNGSSSSTIANISASFGQMARGAFQQIESLSATEASAGVSASLRKLYDSTAAGLSGTAAAAAGGSTDHRLVPPESAPQEEQSPVSPSHLSRVVEQPTPPADAVALADSLKASSVTITDFLMKIESSGNEAVPEKVWEALAQIETVRNQLLAD